MKRFFFRIAVTEASAFEECLASWRKIAPAQAGRAQLEVRPFGLLLRLPAADVELFCAKATEALSPFTRSRLLAAARSVVPVPADRSAARRHGRGLRSWDPE